MSEQCRYCGRPRHPTGEWSIPWEECCQDPDNCRQFLAERVESLTRERDAFKGDADYCREQFHACQTEMDKARAERDAAIKRAEEAEAAIALAQGDAFCCECGGTSKIAERRGKLLERWLKKWCHERIIGNVTNTAELVRETEEELRQ